MTDFTWDEIRSQPEVWQQVIDLCEREKHPDLLSWIHHDRPALTGSGSSFYLSLTAAAAYAQLTGRNALAVSASEVCTFPHAIFSRSQDYSLLAFSRNGKSVETVDAALWFKNSCSSKPVAVSTLTSSPLLEICSPGLLLTAAAEHSRYMTRSFTAPLLAMQYLLASATGNDCLKKELRKLPEIGARVIERCHDTVKQLAQQHSFKDYVGLGQGPFYGLAAESMLKIKEMVHAPAQAYPSLEIMHGPNYFLSENTLVTLLHAESISSRELPLLERLRPSGARRFVICENASPQIQQAAEFVFEIGSGLSEAARLVLAMPIMQLFAYYRARATGKALE